MIIVRWILAVSFKEIPTFPRKSHVLSIHFKFRCPQTDRRSDPFSIYTTDRTMRIVRWTDRRMRIDCSLWP
jgi:hypothetical protein